MRSAGSVSGRNNHKAAPPPPSARSSTAASTTLSTPREEAPWVEAGWVLGSGGIVEGPGGNVFALELPVCVGGVLFAEGGVLFAEGGGVFPVRANTVCTP